LYQLKGEVVARGVKAVTGLEMPVFEKRRFQHGAADRDLFGSVFPSRPADYRKAFHAIYE
jgi:asparagine synthase (glutamine-hydrolysing)